MAMIKIRGRRRRQLRIRRRISGTIERPRLNIFISNQHIYAQLIDDLAGHTLAAANTMLKDLKGAKVNKKAAIEVGKKIAEIAIQKNIRKAVFDRAGYRYHGRVKSLADAAREAGLQF